MAIIYRAINPSNGMSYIGMSIRTLDQVKSRHGDSVRKGSKTKFHNAIRKHGIDYFQWSLLFSGCVRSRSTLCQLERDFIIEYSTKSPNGYNLTDGGDGGDTAGATPEDRARFGDSIRKGQSNPEVRQKMRYRKNKTFDEISPLTATRWKQRIGDTLRGQKRKPTPTEVKQKIAAGVREYHKLASRIELGGPYG